MKISKFEVGKVYVDTDEKLCTLVCSRDEVEGRIGVKFFDNDGKDKPNGAEKSIKVRSVGEDEKIEIFGFNDSTFAVEFSGDITGDKK